MFVVVVVYKMLHVFLFVYVPIPYRPYTCCTVVILKSHIRNTPCRNIVSTVNLGCKLDLKTIALRARNAEYNPKVRLTSLALVKLVQI